MENYHFYLKNGNNKKSNCLNLWSMLCSIINKVSINKNFKSVQSFVIYVLYNLPNCWDLEMEL